MIKGTRSFYRWLSLFKRSRPRIARVHTRTANTCTKKSCSYALAQRNAENILCYEIWYRAEIYCISSRYIFDRLARQKIDLSRRLCKRNKLWLITCAIKQAGFLKDYFDQCFCICISIIRLFDGNSTFVLNAEYSEIFMFATDIVIYDDQPPVHAFQ